MILADDPGLQLSLDGKNRGDLVLDHPADRDAGPVAHDGGDGVRIDHGEDHGLVAMGGGHLCQRLVERLAQRSVVELGAVLSGLDPGVGQGVASGAHPGQRSLLPLPLGGDLVQRRLGLLDLLLQLGDALALTVLAFALPLGDFKLDLQQLHLTEAILHRRRRGMLGHPHARAGGIQQGDRLVGKLTGRDVALGELDGGFDGFVQHHHIMVLLHHRRDGADHADRVCGLGLAHAHRLEAAGKGRVLLEVLSVLGPGGRRDSPQTAAGQGGFQEVSGVARACRTAGANQGVRLINEQDNRLG